MAEKSRDCFKLRLATYLLLSATCHTSPPSAYHPEHIFPHFPHDNHQYINIGHEKGEEEKNIVEPVASDTAANNLCHNCWSAQ